jgi:hypothetical protein
MTWHCRLNLSSKSLVFEEFLCIVRYKKTILSLCVVRNESIYTVLVYSFNSILRQGTDRQVQTSLYNSSAAKQPELN